MVRYLLGLCLIASLGQGGWTAAEGDGTPDLKALYEGHQWFRLRDAEKAVHGSAFYRGAVACALGDFAEAERNLRDFVRSAPQSEEAKEARGLLLYLYQRTGRYRQALSQVDDLLRAVPDAAGAGMVRPLFVALSQYPDQSVTARRHSTVRYQVQGGNLFVPLTINGKPATYLLDTGADFSLLSESEAERVGLKVHDTAARATDSTGGAVQFRTAVADELVVGKARLEHVGFLVFRDEQQPFVNLPPGERGVIGLPVLLGLQTIRWSADGTLEIGFRSAAKGPGKANLCFDGATPTVEAGLGQRRLNLVLDTGATKTDLWPAFAKEFSSLVDESGTKDTRQVAGVGNSIAVDAVSLPELTLEVGGLDTVLRPAHVLLKSVGNERYHGRLGFNVLQQAQRVTLDFKSMRLRLE